MLSLFSVFYIFSLDWTKRIKAVIALSLVITNNDQRLLKADVDKVN